MMAIFWLFRASTGTASNFGPWVFDGDLQGDLFFGEVQALQPSGQSASDAASISAALTSEGSTCSARSISLRVRSA